MQTNIDMPIGRLADELYYLGVKSGPSYLLVCGSELVLIDTSFPGNTGIITDKLSSLGFRPQSIKHIIHTHGHIDHIGSTAKLVGLCGATTYIGKGDEDAAAGKNDLTYAGEYDIDYSEPFVPDVVVHDGYVLDVNGNKIRFMSTPGHTAGTMSLFFDVHHKGKRYKAGMFGGAGLNTLTSEYLTRHRLPASLRSDYLSSLCALEKEDVTFHVGNHPGDNDYYNKINNVGATNPFADDNTYYRFIQKKRAEAEALFDTDPI